MCGHTTGEAAAQPRPSEMKTSSRLYQGFHRDQVLENLRWNDYVCSEGLGIKITSPSIAWANEMMILDSELSLWCSPWACPYISAGAMGNAAPQIAAVIPVECFPGRLFCLSKARLSTTLPARAETTCAPALLLPALLSPTPRQNPWGHTVGSE